MEDVGGLREILLGEELLGGEAVAAQPARTPGEAPSFSKNFLSVASRAMRESSVSSDEVSSSRPSRRSRRSRPKRRMLSSMSRSTLGGTG